MVCKNCGAKMEDGELLCQYCGTENSEVAKKQQEAYLEGYKKKRDELKNAPKKVLKKTTKTLFYALAILLGGLALILVVIFAFSKVTSGDLLAQQEEEIERLEQYYIAGDYETMCDYFAQIGKRGGSYEKYDRIYDIYWDLDDNIATLKNEWEYAGVIELEVTGVERAIEACIGRLAEIKEMEDFDFPYGEKEGALYVREQYMQALKSYMFLTEEEIESAISVYSEEENDYLELAEIAISRMEEKAQ